MRYARLIALTTLCLLFVGCEKRITEARGEPNLMQTPHTIIATRSAAAMTDATGAISLN